MCVDDVVRLKVEPCVCVCVCVDDVVGLRVEPCVCVDDVVRLRVEPCMERVQIFAEELKIEFSGREGSLAQTFCESFVHFDLTHSFIPHHL